MKVNSKGFTLVELIVVMGIIGVLAAGLITLISPTTQLQKANDTKRKSDLSQFQRTLEQYYNDNNSYPPAGASNTVNSMAWGSSWASYNTYLPKDPKNPTRTYAYWASADGQTYAIYTSLERGTNDAQACSAGVCANFAGRITSSPGTACGTCGATCSCNFAVTSSNTTP